MSPSSPTWYAVLGVPRDASTEQIRAAWREATERFGPGSASGQFRMYNEAAEVLLDPERRAEYDATLAPPAEEPAVGSPAEPTARASAEHPAGPAADSDDEGEPVPVAGTPADEPPPPADAGEEDRVAGPEPGPTSRRQLVLTAVLAVLTVAALAVAGWLALEVRADSRIADARVEAPAAAEQAAKAMLSYDYRTLPADRERAGDFLTNSYRDKYLQTFRLLEKNKDGSPGAAVQTKTVVVASVLGSGVVDVEEDKARVLVFVNQTSRKAGGDPQIFQNRVTMTLVKQGDRWLVSGLKSY